jgi:DNA-binding response OmpR family regulator
VLEVELPPLLGGLAVCRQIREQGRTPVILLSANGSDEQVIQGFRAGADTYLSKPVSVQELARQVRAVWGWAVEDLA